MFESVFREPIAIGAFARTGSAVSPSAYAGHDQEALQVRT
jgi:hypothetical protein